MNYFELFEMPISLVVDKNTLAKKYVALQKKYHPDFYTQSDEVEQADMLEKSSLINKAWKVLQNQEETMRYVLLQKGLMQEEEKYQLPPDFLMEMMELNEDLSADSAASVAALENELYKQIKPVIDGFDNNKTSREDLLKIKEFYFKKKYLQRILERLD